MQSLPVDDAFVRALEEKGQLRDGAQRSTTLLKAFLSSDFHLTSKGSLPDNVKSISGALLQGRYILQIDEIVNIAAPLKGRFEEKGRGRMLKFHLTDGKQQVVGLEYRFIPDLAVLSPSGIKASSVYSPDLNKIPSICTQIAVTDVYMRQGILILCPENVDVLGGAVDRLVKAQNATKAVLLKEPHPGRERKCIGRLYEDASVSAWEFEYVTQLSHIRSMPSHILQSTSLRVPGQQPPSIPGIPQHHTRTISDNENTKPPTASKTREYRSRPYGSFNGKGAGIGLKTINEVQHSDRDETISTKPKRPPLIQDVIDLIDDE